MAEQLDSKLLGRDFHLLGQVQIGLRGAKNTGRVIMKKKESTRTERKNSGKELRGFDVHMRAHSVFDYAQTTPRSVAIKRHKA